MTTSSSTKLTLKLLIDTEREIVLFAEASKQVIDFLLSLLCLPLATVARLLPKNEMAGSYGNIYESVENLSVSYMQPTLQKDVLLNPKIPISSAYNSRLLPEKHDPVVQTQKTAVYMCFSRCTNYVTRNKNDLCPKCRCPMSILTFSVDNKVGGDVVLNKCDWFVREAVTYMVMDDLVIQPFSTISSITLLKTFKIKSVDVLQEKVVDFGMTEAVNLLKASMDSKTVLTNTFLKNNTLSGRRRKFES